MMQGVIMPTDKKSTVVAPPKSSAPEKEYWIVLSEGNFVVATESEIIANPAEYLNKPMYEKPKDQYEVVVCIKKKGK